MKVRIRELLDSYPRRRPPLSEAHRERYLRDYQENREGRTVTTSIAQHLESWMHRQVAVRSRPGDRILELGAGTLNHLPYECAYERYDVVEPFVDLYRGSVLLNSVSNCYHDIAEVPAGMRYDRIMSVAVLEHLTDLPSVLRQCARLLASDGIFQTGIPSEGGLAWWLAWRFGTGPAYRRRTGLDYATLMRHEHVNRAPEIIALARYFFRDITIRRFPLPAHHLSLYCYFEARNPTPEPGWLE
jgi:SAM-dependent methyltransferase